MILVDMIRGVMKNIHNTPSKRRGALFVQIHLYNHVSYGTFLFLYKNESERKNMKRFITTLCALAMSLSLAGCTAGLTDTSTSTTETSSSTSEKKTVLRIGMECDYAPSNWQEDTASDTNLPISNLEGFYAEGYDVQMSKLLAEEMDVDIEIVKLAWTGLIQALKEGQIDLIIAGMADTPERKESIAFSDTYSHKKSQYVLVVPADSPYKDATDIQEFAGATVIGQINTFYDTAIDQIEGVVHATPAQDVPNMASQLQEGLVDAVILDDDTADALYGDNDNYTILQFEDGHGFTLEFTGSCVGIRLEDTELLDEVNTALSHIDTETREQIWETAVANQPE